MRSGTHFAIEVARAGQLLVLRGRLDVRVTADVRLALAAALADGSGPLVVDVAALDGVDAPGLGVLVGAHRRAGRSGRTLVLRDVPPQLSRALLLTRLDRVLRTTRTVVLT
jgi:anti-anti-sigma factor